MNIRGPTYPKVLEAALWKHFGEWGEVENVNLIARLSIAFVRYRYRMTKAMTMAQFFEERCPSPQ